MRISVGSDHAGFAVKQAIARRLRELGHDVIDHGCDSEASVRTPSILEVLADSPVQAFSKSAIDVNMFDHLLILFCILISIPTRLETCGTAITFDTPPVNL